MIDNNKGKTREKRKKRRRHDGIRNMKEQARQMLPKFTAEASLQHIASQRYHLARKYAKTPTADISSAASSFLNYLCYYKCMIRCNIICSPPRMCLISCPQLCRAECGRFGIL
jgi:hypothetical protein